MAYLPTSNISSISANIATVNTLTVIGNTQVSNNLVVTGDVTLNGGVGALTVNGTANIISTVSLQTDASVTGNVYVNGAKGIRTNSLEANSGSNLTLSPGGNTTQIIIGDPSYAIGTLGTFNFTKGAMAIIVPQGQIQGKMLYAGLNGTQTFSGENQPSTSEYGILSLQNLAGNTGATFSLNKILVPTDTVSYNTTGLQGGNWLSVGGVYGATPWKPNTAFSLNKQVGNLGNLYIAIQGGTSNTDTSNTGPTGNTLSANISDGTIIWNYIGLNGAGSRAPFNTTWSIQSQIGAVPGSIGSGDIDRQWQAEVLTTSINWTQGGTAPTNGQSRGFIYAGGDQMWAFSGATNLSGVLGREIDCGIFAGASAAVRTGLLITSHGDVQGNDLDTGLKIVGSALGANSSLRAPPYRDIIGLAGGVINNTSTIIRYQPPVPGSVSPTTSVEPAPNASIGIDFTAISFANAAFKSSGGFMVDGDGDVRVGAANIVTSQANSTTMIDVNGYAISSFVNIFGTATGYANSDQLFEPITGTIFNVTVALNRNIVNLTPNVIGAIYGAQPTNPVTLLGGTGNGCKANLTWTPITTLTLNPSGTTNVANNLVVTGTTNFSGNVTAANVTISGTTTATGNVTLTSGVQYANTFQPYLSCNLHNGFTLANGIATKIPFDTVSLDSGKYWDSVNFRYTPQVAGKYMVHSQVMSQWTGASFGANNSYQVFIYKNGIPYTVAKIAPNSNSSFNESLAAFALLPMNGSTDYIETFAILPGANSAINGLANNSITLIGCTQMVITYIGQ